MTSPDEQPASDLRRVRPYAMTGGRTRPTHDALEIETLVCTTSVGEQTPKLTVEQRAIAALCHDILSIAEVSAKLHLPWASSGSWLVTWPMSSWSWSTGRPTVATVPTWPCWSGCSMGCTPSDSQFAPPRRGSPTRRTHLRPPAPPNHWRGWLAHTCDQSAFSLACSEVTTGDPPSRNRASSGRRDT